MAVDNKHERMVKMKAWKFKSHLIYLGNEEESQWHFPGKIELKRI